jgi:PKD repeat protein
MMTRTAIITFGITVRAALLLANSGEIVGWGYNQYGQAHGSPGMDVVQYVSVAAGGEHTLAITTNATVTGWGDNAYGQVSCPAGAGFSAVAAGNAHSLGLSNGAVLAWGDNLSGQLNAPSNADFVAIAAGGEHSVGLTADGRCIAWGNNDYGQTNVPYGEDYIQITAGEYHSLALRRDGSLVGWGLNTYGQSTCPPGFNYVAIAAGFDHSVALRSDGAVIAWGNNDYGQTNHPLEHEFVAIAAGDNHSVALRNDGSVAGWGDDGDGQSTAPEGYLFTAVSAGNAHSVALQVPGLTCRFSADRLLGLRTLPVQFIAQTSSTNAANIYCEWDLQNDGVPDTNGFGIAQVTYFYTTGVYSVRLFVSNVVGESAAYFKTNYITVYNNDVSADFSADILTGAAPLKVQFMDHSLFTPHFWQWDFDSDGTIDSGSRNPIHNFITAGVYSVTLTVSNDFGLGSGASHSAMTRTNYITVYPQVIPDFSVSATRILTNIPLQFTDLSSNGPTAWYWDFDNDGSVDSTLQHPTWSYTQAGIKSVRLLISNEYSGASLLRERIITVLAGNLTNYVWQSGASLPPYDTWATAATNIQDAIDLSMPNGIVMLSNDVYTSAGQLFEGTNVFVATNGVSLIGCGTTIVDGGNAMRGGYLSGSRLSQVQLRRGAAFGAAESGRGGGIYLSGDAVLDRCVFVDNAARDGGGVYAEDEAALYSCLFVSNRADSGGGFSLTNAAVAYNATVVHNNAVENGGGIAIAGGSVWNTIVWDNAAATHANIWSASSNVFNFGCATPDPGGSQNVVDVPLLLDDFSIAPESPCVDAGTNFAWMTAAYDLAGEPRMQGEAVDMGAFETLPEPSLILGLIGMAWIGVCRRRSLEHHSS